MGAQWLPVSLLKRNRRIHAMVAQDVDVVLAAAPARGGLQLADSPIYPSERPDCVVGERSIVMSHNIISKIRNIDHRQSTEHVHYGAGGRHISEDRADDGSGDWEKAFMPPHPMSKPGF